MAKVLKIDDSHDPGHEEYMFRCPGCNCAHIFIVKWGKWNLKHRKKYISGESIPTWTFNGDLDKPTFSPSLLYQSKKCHLFLKDGIIEFHSECGHALAGQKIELKDLKEQK